MAEDLPIESKMNDTELALLLEKTEEEASKLDDRLDQLLEGISAMLDDLENPNVRRITTAPKSFDQE